MSEGICPKSKVCKIYNNKLLKNKETEEAYKNLYCNNSNGKHAKCKRYLIEQELGYCPDFVMPNSFLSIEEIIEQIEEKQENQNVVW